MSRIDVAPDDRPIFSAAARSTALIGATDDVVVTDPREFVPTVGARFPHRRLPDGRSTLDLVDPLGFVVLSTDNRAEPRPGLTVLPRDTLPVMGSWLVRPYGHVAADVTGQDVDAVVESLGVPVAAPSATLHP